LVPQVVDTEGGPVTLLDLAGLRARVNAFEAEADKDAQQAASLRALAEDLWVQVGRTLTAKLGQWSPSPPVAPLAQQAILLNQRVAADDSELQSIHEREHGGFSGLAGKLGGWNESRKLSKERADLESLLRTLFTQIARQSPQAALP
jgi:hypothetical protein